MCDSPPDKQPIPAGAMTQTDTTHSSTLHNKDKQKDREWSSDIHIVSIQNTAVSQYTLALREREREKILKHYPLTTNLQLALKCVFFIFLFYTIILHQCMTLQLEEYCCLIALYKCSTAFQHC